MGNRGYASVTNNISLSLSKEVFSDKKKTSN